jgi:hypothetical protein
VVDAPNAGCVTEMSKRNAPGDGGTGSESVAIRMQESAGAHRDPGGWCVGHCDHRTASLLQRAIRGLGFTGVIDERKADRGPGIAQLVHAEPAGRVVFQPA